jgi:hypothetical protein
MDHYLLNFLPITRMVCTKCVSQFYIPLFFLICTLLFFFWPYSVKLWGLLCTWILGWCFKIDQTKRKWWWVTVRYERGIYFLPQFTYGLYGFPLFSLQSIFCPCLPWWFALSQLIWITSPPLFSATVALATASSPPLISGHSLVNPGQLRANGDRGSGG